MTNREWLLEQIQNASDELLVNVNTREYNIKICARIL